MTAPDAITLTIEYRQGLEDADAVESTLKEDNRALETTFDVDFLSQPYAPPTPFLEFEGLSLGDVAEGFESELYRIRLGGTRVSSLCPKCFVAIYGCLVPPVDLKPLLCGKSRDEVCEKLTRLKGSYSLIYISFHMGHIYVCKDEYGYKSLLFRVDKHEITVSNVALDTSSRWYEVPPFKLLVIGNAVSFLPRRDYYLSQLLKARFTRLDDLVEDIVLNSIDSIKKALVESVLDVCSRRREKDFVTILFSGGLDSALIARIVAEHLKDTTIELINVSFDPATSPDRITSLYTYSELVEMFPNSDIRLVCIDVNQDEYVQDEEKIYGLSYPNDTHMDVNISAALYYASRLKGFLCDKSFLQSSFWQTFRSDLAVAKSVNFKVTVSRAKSADFPEQESSRSAVTQSQSTEGQALPFLKKCGEQPYSSHSTDVLVGSGADELFGGYGRHVTSQAFQDCKELGEEIAKDLNRLWKRNLGRDDRVLNENGVRALYPFLSPLVLETVTKLPFTSASIVDILSSPKWFHELCIYKSIDYGVLRNSEFLGAENRPVSVYINKWILREIALQLGLKSCATFKKRAIQFGTNSAKNFNRLHNMSNRQARNKGAAVYGSMGFNVN
ncbi:asparagine synthetase family member protein [Theileria equi strain WA]|uniref:Asparagine synthetase family member protein n=1 Tax=Theileria equi strain WA TaxID=1537102 RepID=L0AYT6_THEEQ|nr:asparagine synthetase family member protein [Theileria equi strain WA]AFZ80186.1 asparagine synthetase family member protein [Theileria equi strain WA]|eukprot:XP_004829852.1 asparagine synthetase family member protein [Theileria equi strain WA]